MKILKKVEKDPINDKYNPKIGFFKKIHLKFLKVKNSLKANKDLNEDVTTAKQMAAEIVIYGVLSCLSLTLFGIGFSFINLVATGSFLWLIENKFIEMITRVIGSLTLVEVHN